MTKTEKKSGKLVKKKPIKRAALAKTDEAETPRSSALVKYTKAEINLIKKTVAKGASDLELQLFLYVCKQTGLNPLLRQIYSIRRRQWNSEKWNQEKGKYGDYDYVMTTQLGIDGLRLIAQRTGEYAGQKGPEWCGKDGAWKDLWVPKKDEPYPFAARVGIKREGFDDVVWGVATWDEYVQRNSKGDVTAMWRDKGTIMLAKCAEAQGLRKAFPAELSGLYTFDEMKVEDPDKEQVDNAEVARTGKKVQRFMMLAKQVKNPDTGEPYTDAEIHETLETKYNVKSSKQLSEAQLDKLISTLEKALTKQERSNQKSKAKAVAGNKEEGK